MTNQIKRARQHCLCAFVLIAGCVAGALGQPETPEAFLAAVNKPWVGVPATDRADAVLLPALAQMDAPPSALLDSPAATLMLQPGDTTWAAVEEWALADHQRTALKAFRQVTEASSQFVFALPYGRLPGASGESAAQQSVDAGSPALLAAMQFDYLQLIDNGATLVWAEATRLAASGQSAAGADLMIRLVRLGRMLADRPFAKKSRVGFVLMNRGVETTLDLLYTFPDQMSGQQLTALITALDPKTLRLDRIRPPTADRFTLRQVVLESFAERGKPDPDRFAALVSIATAADPLLAFSHAEWWRRAADRHAGYFETLDKIDGVYSDWELRWGLDPEDPVVLRSSEYNRLDPAKFSLIAVGAFDLERLMERRLRLRTELAGARLALAILAYHADRKAWPKPVVAVRPRYIRQIPLDPLAPANDEAPMTFFVPMRDQTRGPREVPQPHKLTIVGSLAQHLSSEPSRLKQWRSSIRIDKFTSDPASLEAVVDRATTLLRILVALGVQPANVDLVNSSNLKEALPVLAGSLGLGPDETNLVPPVIMTLMKESKPFQDVYKVVARIRGRRGRLTRVNGAQLRTTFIEASLAVQRVKVRLLATGATSFSTELDDSTFVVYSVGDDLKADWASSVGPLGDDTLVWPPLISLYRQHLRSESESQH